MKSIISDPIHLLIAIEGILIPCESGIAAEILLRTEFMCWPLLVLDYLASASINEHPRNLKRAYANIIQLHIWVFQVQDETLAVKSIIIDLL